MLTGSRHICVAWAAIGLLTLATGIAAGQSDLARVGAFALVAFGTLRLAMASDDFGTVADWFALRRGHAPSAQPAARGPRGFWYRPAPYVLLPLIGFIVFVGRVLWKPPLGEDARYLITGVMAAALTVTVVYLVLLAVEGYHASAVAPAGKGGAPQPAAPAGTRAGEDALAAIGGLDTAQFTRDVLDVERQGTTSR